MSEEKMEIGPGIYWALGLLVLLFFVAVGWWYLYQQEPSVETVSVVVKATTPMKTSVTKTEASAKKIGWAVEKMAPVAGATAELEIVQVAKPEADQRSDLEKSLNRIGYTLTNSVGLVVTSKAKK